MFGSFLPSSWLVRTTEAYSGTGADIVMESIALKMRKGGKLGEHVQKPTGRIYPAAKMLIEF